MADRAADATIKGYYYQFDTSILKLLDLPADTDSITVEGIEDIDINTATENSTIQCKYLSKPTFINSAVRDPIILMLDHYLNPLKLININYVLYAHFENETPGNEPVIDLVKLKAILTFSEKKVVKHYEIEKGITDIQLNAFLAQFKFIFGVEFDTQQKNVIDRFKRKFNCSEFEADTLYYNNALRIIIDKSIKKATSERLITRAEFISVIDCKKKLFNEWFIKLRSKKEYLKLIAQTLKATRVLEPSRVKMILLGKNLLEADNSEMPLSILFEGLINRYYKLNHSLRDAKPLVVVLDCDKTELVNVKRNLIDFDLIFNDGFEEIKFSTQIFNREPVINVSNNAVKILKASYLIKIISKETLLNYLPQINSPSAFFIFSKDDYPIRFPNGQFYDIKYCENLKEVYKLLTP